MNPDEPTMEQGIEGGRRAVLMVQGLGRELTDQERAALAENLGRDLGFAVRVEADGMVYLRDPAATRIAQYLDGMARAPALFPLHGAPRPLAVDSFPKFFDDEPAQESPDPIATATGRELRVLDLWGQHWKTAGRYKADTKGDARAFHKRVEKRRAATRAKKVAKKRAKKG